jgi:hypothetical protein
MLRSRFLGRAPASTADPICLDRVDEGPPITLRLIGIRHREFCDCFFEWVASPIGLASARPDAIKDIIHLWTMFRSQYVSQQ